MEKKKKIFLNPSIREFLPRFCYTENPFRRIPHGIVKELDRKNSPPGIRVLLFNGKRLVLVTRVKKTEYSQRNKTKRKKWNTHSVFSI